jgi:hypothetical protein
MDELKRPGVVGGKIRTVTNAQYGRLLQLIYGPKTKCTRSKLKA